MRHLTPLLAIVVIATLAACTPTAPPVTPGASSSPKPTESVEPVVEETAPEPALIVISHASWTIADSAGAVTDTFDYQTDPAAAVARLTEVFDAAPAISNDEGNFHEWPSVIYTWSGFSVIDYIGGDSIPFGADYDVSSTAAAVGGIVIEGPGGVTVGDTTATAIAAGGTAFSEMYDVVVSWVEIDAVPDPSPDWAGWEGGPRIFVRLALDAPSGAVTTIAAPMVNYYP